MIDGNGGAAQHVRWSRPGLPTVVTNGMVISVNGSSAAGACGVGGTSGTFTVMRRNASQTVVNVTPTTKFREGGVHKLTFSIVCVNEIARAAGTVSGSALNATDIHVWSPPGTP